MTCFGESGRATLIKDSEGYRPLTQEFCFDFQLIFQLCLVTLIYSTDPTTFILSSNSLKTEKRRRTALLLSKSWWVS